MNGSQITAGIEKYSLNESPIGFITSRRYIDVEPLKDALLSYHLPFYRKTNTLKPLKHMRSGARIRLWIDLAIPGDGFLYLYILDDEDLSIWKRDLSLIEPWQKSLALEGIPAEQFWVANHGNFTTITTVTGKVYHLQGKTLFNKANSFSPLDVAVTRAEIPEDSTTVFIDDLNTGEQWSLSMDAVGKTLSKPHHLMRDSLISENLPNNLAKAVQKALPLNKNR